MYGCACGRFLAGGERGCLGSGVSASLLTLPFCSFWIFFSIKWMCYSFYKKKKHCVSSPRKPVCVTHFHICGEGTTRAFRILGICPSSSEPPAFSKEILPFAPQLGKCHNRFHKREFSPFPFGESVLRSWLETNSPSIQSCFRQRDGEGYADLGRGQEPVS